jgi:hypothetical protein
MALSWAKSSEQYGSVVGKELVDYASSKAFASASVAEERTDFMMAEWTWTAPFSGGGVPSGSGVAVGSSRRSLRKY